MWSDFKVKKKVWVDERGDKKNGGKRSCNECDEPTTCGILMLVVQERLQGN